MIMSIVYLLTNKVNGKRYVGKTSRPLDVRWQGHLGSARRGDSDMLVCRAIKKHGSEAFERRVIEECDEVMLAARETHWIRELRTHVSEGGYNLTYGGDGGLPGYKFSEASKEKMRQKALGRKHTEETKAKMRAAKLDKKQSAEHVAARVAKNTGKKRTEEQKARMKAGQQAACYHHSDEVRAKISEAARNRVISEETKQKLREANTGRSQTEDVKRRISAARSRAVQQFDERGTLIGSYPSIKEAARLSGCAVVSISRSISWKKTIAGYRWQYRVEGT